MPDLSAAALAMLCVIVLNDDVDTNDLRTAVPVDNDHAWFGELDSLIDGGWVRGCLRGGALRYRPTFIGARLVSAHTFLRRKAVA